MSEGAQAMGVGRALRGKEAAVGQWARAKYPEQTGEEPQKARRFVDGAERLVNLYYESHRPLLEAAIREHLERHVIRYDALQIRSV
jgi:hypothetical protein